ncbi:MAG: hypothetical protein ACI4VI_04900 [Acutalibacteraceae bacterium]
MDFVFDFLFEIIAEPVIECYMAVMYHFFDSNKKVSKNTNIIIVFIVLFECLALLLMFVIGAVMSLESGGNSLAGKILFISSVLMSIVQIVAGIILRKKRKAK